MVDWAYALHDVLTEHYCDAEKIILVMDNLNTNSLSSFYEDFAPAEARALTERLEIPRTAKHGSWLNIAECKFSVLSRQCLDRRISDAFELGAEAEAWQAERNRTANKIHWQFSTADARRKLRRLYPAFIHRTNVKFTQPTKVFN